MNGSWAMRGGRLIDGTGRAPIPEGVVKITDGRIESVGPVADYGQTGLAGLEVVDVEGKTVLPGLVNSHEHLDLRFSYGSYEERIAQPYEVWLARAARNALLALAEGITTARDLASRNGNSVQLKRIIADGLLLGPRLVSCGRPLSMTGGHGAELCIEADGPDEVRKAARRVIKSGADLIKCMASGDFMVRGVDQPSHAQFTVEEMRAAFEEAHKAEKLTTVHCHPPQAIRGAVEAGVDCIEHGALLDRPTSELLAEKGVYLVPTLGETFSVVERGSWLGKPEWLIDVLKGEVDNRRTCFSHALEADVAMAVGTDTSDTMAQEMGYMAMCGMAPMAVLLAATATGAAVCGLGDQVGSLEPGKWADLVVVDGDPLVDMQAIEHVTLVVKEGVRHDPGMLRAAAGRYPL